ncbi:alkaline-phosphatase-like protein [Gongronella butleri]|nr:alkaline-phosphatase-like protein [Gongronella butleri]
MASTDPLLSDQGEEEWDMDKLEPLSSQPAPPPRRSVVLRLVIVVSVITLTLLGITVAAMLSPLGEEPPTTSQAKNETKIQQQIQQQPRNVIFMISDGLGPASVSFARTYYQYIHNKPYDYEMPLDTIHVGQSRTRSASTLVTDSAAGATAFSCGLKTYNRGIGVDPQRKPCGTIMESAKMHLGMKTGLVATSRITHATPASFNSHVVDRDNENAIAVQQVGDNPLAMHVDLMFGGGYCHFLPKSSKEGCRGDERNLFDEAIANYNWSTVQYGNRSAWDALPADNASALPAISLFSSGHMSYEIDRDASQQPSLSEMTDKALQMLSNATKEGEKGFFLMVEGSRIDMAAHSNDPAAHVHDILEYQDTVALVKAFVDQNPNTLLISTSDHETGGLSLARQVSNRYPKYLWYPDVLKNIKSSTAELARKIQHMDTDAKVQNVKDNLGITDITDDEKKSLAKPTSVKHLDQFLADMVSLRSQLGWATHGHSGVDVNLYAYGHSAKELRGSRENTAIGLFLAKRLGLDLNTITLKLNENDPQFHLAPLTEEMKIEYTDHLDQYHHDERLLHHPHF